MKKMPKHIGAFIAIITGMLLISFLTAGTLQGGMRHFIDLLFISGAIAMAIAGIIVLWVGKPRREEPAGNKSGVPSEDRKTRARIGKTILLYGLALVCLSVLLGTLFW